MNKRYLSFALGFLGWIYFFTPHLSEARIGVGVGTGKIQVDENLKPGLIYNLPSLTVLNTGDEDSDYRVSVTYHEDQEQQRPLDNWFDFSPNDFPLSPQEAKQVDITLKIPLKTQPGDYFAYLEAAPIKKDDALGANVGVAAASKLYFTVSPANFIQGIYYRLTSLWSSYLPWSNIIAGGSFLAVLLINIKKRIKINITLDRKNPPSKKIK